MDLLLSSVIEHPDLDEQTKSAVLRAFNKVIWIQNDCASPPPPSLLGENVLLTCRL